MNYRYFLFFILIPIISFSCNNPSPEGATVAVKEGDITRDTIIELETTNFKNVQDWEAKDFIIKKPEGFPEDRLIGAIDQMNKEWKYVVSPLTLVYEGVEMGDYFHILFKDEESGRVYDFGDGNNNLEDYKIVVEDDGTNEEFLGKTFKVTWDWKESSFPCCSGENFVVEGYRPSIVGLELVETGK